MRTRVICSLSRKKGLQQGGRLLMLIQGEHSIQLLPFIGLRQLRPMRRTVIMRRQATKVCHNHVTRLFHVRSRQFVTELHTRFLKDEARSELYFGSAAAVLLLAVWQGRLFGDYTLFGALLLIPAVAFCAAGISASSSEHTTKTASQYQFLLRLLVCAAMLSHLISALWRIYYIPGGIIDVYIFQKQSAAALIHGIDPYSLTTPNIYGSDHHFYGPGMVVNGRVQIGYPYPPASLFFVIPFYLMGDIRYAYVAAVLISAWLLITLRTNFITIIVACLLLLSPVTLYVESRSWTEPFVLLALTCTVYAAMKRSPWLPLALGVLLASKQYCILAVPFTPLLLAQSRWNRQTVQLIIRALAVFSALTLPMAMWNLHGFLHDFMAVHVRQPFRSDSLSIANLICPLPLYLIVALVLVGTLFALNKARPHPSMFAACYGFTLLIFVCTNKQAFCNYYFLIVQTLLLAVATLRVSISALSVGKVQGLDLPVLEPAYYVELCTSGPHKKSET